MAASGSVRHRLAPVALFVIVLICPGLCGYWYWLHILLPPRLTSLHAAELAPAIGKFEAMELSLDVQLQPNLLLSAITQGYYNRLLQFHMSLNCAGCGQFQVTTAAEAMQVCVLSYSRTEAVARASVRVTTMQVDSLTYKPLGHVASSIYRSTYRLERQDNQWKIADVTNFTVPNEGEADAIQVAQEYLVELGCQ